MGRPESCAGASSDALINAPAGQALCPGHKKAFRGRPSKLFVEITSRCNLSCRMCSKQGAGGRESDGDLLPEHYENLYPAFGNLDALILSGIGEPLLHPRLELFVQEAKDRLPPEGWVGIQSNGMLIDAGSAAAIVGTGIDCVCISVDAASPELFRSLRTGGEFALADRALIELNRAAETFGRYNFRSGVEFVCLRENFHELPNIIRWASDRGARFVIVSQILPYHENLIRSSAYDTNTSNAVAFFRKWRDTAMKEGLDLTHSCTSLSRFSGKADGNRFPAFLQNMVQDAYEHNVSLHIERLFGMNEELIEKVAGVFKESQRVAESCGIGLSLPEVIPLSNRRCDFIEDGCAFVSWKGTVHPCRFLWHRGICYLGGFTKYVTPVSFGSLSDTDILSIWNDPAFRLFREEASRYDFPFCYDCNFALCDLVQTDDFRQDCYLGTVPCGTCMWCTGLFRCLQ